MIFLLTFVILSLPGKSYTMIGRDDSLQGLGIIPCAISWLFKLINERKEKTGARFSVRVSAVEVWFWCEAFPAKTNSFRKWKRHLRRRTVITPLAVLVTVKHLSSGADKYIPVDRPTCKMICLLGHFKAVWFCESFKTWPDKDCVCVCV